MRASSLPTATLLACAAAVLPPVAHAQRAAQPVDTQYTRLVRELTPTDPRWSFTTELVDHLPASATVPTPLRVLGYVPGTIGRLSHVADVNRYFRALAAASPRVRIFPLGTSDEGREMLVVAIADDSVLATLEENRRALATLADPRTRTDAERDRLVRRARPTYWLTGSIHSPEVGSPEMLMELAYRLAVDEGETARAIRANVVTLVTPILEVDGRDRVVDLYAQARRLGLGPTGSPLVYWGKYTAHDNNRDAMVLSQRLTQAFSDGFLHWRPTVAHDLHESVPFLYTSTGTGPYNDEYDPIVVSEWNQLAQQEIAELTRRGLPGVWTHGFYDGWAANYTVLSVANLHNGIGRFYETYTSNGADCQTVSLPAAALERVWYRTNPPVNGVRWCMRSNINYQQSGVLVALAHVARNRETFLANAAAKAERMVQRGRTRAPYAYVIPRGQRRAAEAADLVNLFRRHGSEVHVAGAPLRVTLATGNAGGVAGVTATGAGAARAIAAGDWVVRMDQPYTATVRTLLSLQRYKPDDPAPYDDTGWTLDALRGVETFAVADSGVLALAMTRLDTAATVTGTIAGDSTTSAAVLAVTHLGDWRSAVLPWRARGAEVRVAERAFRVDTTSFPAGTYLVRDVRGAAARAVRDLGLRAVPLARLPDVAAHPVTLPRVALVHSWLETQNEGWVRFAFDQLGIPYTYLGDQTLGRAGALDRFDVVVYPHVNGTPGTILAGRPRTGPPIPWRRTAATPHLGRWDETDDLRPGLGLEGAAALRRFVERGGLLVTEGGTTRVPIELGFNATVSAVPTTRLRAQGTILRAQAGSGRKGDSAAVLHPALYGYERTTLPLIWVQGPAFAVQAPDTTGRDALVAAAVRSETERARARVLLRWHDRADSLLVSGLLVGAEEIAGRAALVDAPLGRGHVLLFGTRPFWRWETQGAFALAVNAMAHWNRLDVAAPPPVADRATASDR
ncbi:MAG TPA: M14 family zinc carboxypeptidase [Gemmatirosa sp.]|nr:M14 family zinc carboxypeptidase [Gemmatirosa sp.]